ncbi:MAG TPA: DUF6457 domain-containing protein [Candidatus Dormibacteraeota bacterium]|nr:DUF6457 domain-containing protein [Candidatus Dormibacteraeota bacterium]
MNAFFETLGARFRDKASASGASIEAPTLDAAVAQELLELARVVAHTHERRFAPLSTYLAGVASERARQSGSVGAADLIREVRRSLEAEHPGA